MDNSEISVSRGVEQRHAGRRPRGRSHPSDPGSVAGATERSSVWPSVTRQMGVQGLHLVLILRNCWARLLAVCSEGRGVRWDPGVILEA